MSNNSLRNILNENIENHKNEIKHISRGMLLNKFDLNQSQKEKRWASINSLKHSDEKILKRDLQVEVRRDETFNSRMLMFTLGPNPPVDRKTHSSRSMKPMRLRAMDVCCEIKDLVPDKSHTHTTPFSEIITDKSRSPERYNFTSPRYYRRDQHINESDTVVCTADLVPHYIHPRYKTQYEQLLRFRSDNIREDDQREQNLIAGTNLIHHLEIRLQKKLESLNKTGRGPNFVRLQVFSELLGDLISESWMFAPLLIRIKSAYDDEVDRVLELPVIQKELLASEVEQLKNSIYHKEKLENLQSEIVQLDEAVNVFLESEETCNNLLAEENQKLEELIKEKSNFDEERKKKYKPKAIAAAPSESEKLELLKIQCWDLMDDISKIQRETRQNMVSRATILHLSEGLQDIGIEVEKLNYHKSQLSTETEAMQTELYGYIVEEQMTEDDFKLIEDILNAPSPLSFTDYEQSNKWSWYIS